MVLYTAEMKHNAETVKQFTLLQYNTFEWWRKLVLIILSAAMILFGVLYGSSSGSSVLTILCLFAGCILFTNLDARAKAVASQVAETMHGQFPTLQYSFSEAGFSDGEDRPVVSYERMYRMIEDDSFLFLFTSKASGYMLRKDSVQGEGGSEGLKALLSERSGLPWKKPFSLLTFRLWDLIPRTK